VITNDVSDYINLLVRSPHIICNHPLLPAYFVDDVASLWELTSSS